MSDLTIRWPDEDAERIEAARGRLELAGQGLARRGFESVMAVLAEVFDRWHAPDSTFRRRLVDEHAEAAGFSPQLVAAGLDLGLADWDGAALSRAIEQERRALLAEPGRALAPFASTSIVLGGAIPMPSLLQPVLSLALLSPVLVRPASRDPVTPRLLAESIAAVDDEIGRAVEVVSFPADDAACLARFLASECVVASGSDETIAAIRGRLQAGQRFVAYGHKLSVAVLDAELVADDAQALAGAVALDVSLWDQQGCLSPAAVYVIGRGAAEAAVRFGDVLADQLEGLAGTLPRGGAPAPVATDIVQERDAAALRAAAGAPVRVHAGAGTSFTVVVEPDAEWRPCPGHRFVRVHPVENGEALSAALRPLAAWLSSSALAANGALHDELCGRLASLGASRICPPGRMQAPPIDWPHDGRPILAPLARAALVDPPEPA